MATDHIVHSKIKAFRLQGFDVVTSRSSEPAVQVLDKHKTYLSLGGRDASSFLTIANKLARIHALSIRDAYRLQGFRALQSHLQLTLSLNAGGSGEPHPMQMAIPFPKRVASSR